MEPPGLGTEPPQDGDEPGTGVAWGQSPAGGGRGDTWGWGQGWILPGAGPGAAAPYPREIFSSQRQQEDVEGQLGWHRRGGTVEPTPRPCPHPGANGDPGAVPMRPAGCAPPKPHRDQPHGAGLSHGPVCHRELGTRPRYPLCVSPPRCPPVLAAAAQSPTGPRSAFPARHGFRSPWPPPGPGLRWLLGTRGQSQAPGSPAPVVTRPRCPQSRPLPGTVSGDTLAQVTPNPQPWATPLRRTVALVASGGPRWPAVAHTPPLSAGITKRGPHHGDTARPRHGARIGTAGSRGGTPHLDGVPVTGTAPVPPGGF